MCYTFSVLHFFKLHSFHVAPFFLLHCFHVVPFVLSFHVALFSCCTHLVLYFFHVTLFLLKSFHIAHFWSCARFVLHFFPVVLFHVELFPCCTFSSVASCCTISVLYSFRAILFPCCTFYMLYSFPVEPFFELHFFRVALFSYCTFFLMALFWNCTFLEIHHRTFFVFYFFRDFICCALLTQGSSTWRETENFEVEIIFLAFSHTSFLPLTSNTSLYFMAFCQNSFLFFYFDIPVLTIFGTSCAIFSPDLQVTELT